MRIIIKGNRMLLVVLVLSMAMCLTGCLPGYTLWLTTLEEDSEEEMVEEEAEKEVEEKKKQQLQIRSLEGITLDDQEATLPYNIIMYDDSTKAFENSVRIHLKENEERIIYFSVTESEDFSLESVDCGIIVEENTECDGCSDWNVKTVGDIQTFSLNLPIISNPSTIVYQMHNGENYIDDDRFIAFYLIPPDSSETEN